ncbi:MAG: EAL domain-containing protein [Nitrosomonas sp.]|nr:EAL domain-containing protein [Nitrosomonas sp.]MDP1951292.1 EAL domain-containing protein [Nitrosomonas sp.]
MHKSSIFSAIKPYLIGSIAITAVALLVTAIYFVTRIELEWIAGLWGILITSILMMINQIAQTEQKIKKYTTQLITSKERLASEIKHHLWAEKTISESKIRSQFIDENFSILLAYFNIEQRCRYHNQAYRNWIGLKSNQIDGQFLHEFSSQAFHVSAKNCIKNILAGEIVFNERVLKSAKGQVFHLTEQFIPHFDSKGKVIGFYTLYTPRIPGKDLISPPNRVARNIPETSNQTIKTNSGTLPPNTDQSKQPSKSGLSAARIAQAIDGGEFRLYCQKIISIKNDSYPYEIHEILIRMAEEENNLMPPGAFLPFVEKYKMMTRLDRWVVSHIIQWLSIHKTSSKSMFSINVTKDTIRNEDFPTFVQDQLQKTKVPASALCFEIEESDALADLSNTLVFAEKIRQLGCLISLCSFNHKRNSLDLLRKIKVDFIKIDGSLVWNILRDQEDLAKVVAINRIARAIKVKTIAELVETDDIIIKLREIGIDFAQGFGVASPQPIKTLE